MAVSKRLRFEILKRDEHKCKYCGRMAPEVVLQVDHVVPVTLGGSDDPSNLVAACRDCNSGKSSIPADAPLVAEVADKALAWAEAMRIVAEERAAVRDQSQKHYAKFRKEWNAWKDWRGNPEPLPGGWKSSIDQLLNAGLGMEDILEMVDVAMGAKAKDTWKYFCGCCWKRLTQMQDRAKEILATPAPAPVDDGPSFYERVGGDYIFTKWSQEDINENLTDAMAYARKWVNPETIDKLGCSHTTMNHCNDPVCMVEYATSLMWLGIRRQGDSVEDLDMSLESVDG